MANAIPSEYGLCLVKRFRADGFSFVFSYPGRLSFVVLPWAIDILPLQGNEKIMRQSSDFPFSFSYFLFSNNE